MKYSSTLFAFVAVLITSFSPSAHDFGPDRSPTGITPQETQSKAALDIALEKLGLVLKPNVEEAALCASIGSPEEAKIFLTGDLEVNFCAPTNDPEEAETSLTLALRECYTMGTIGSPIIVPSHMQLSSVSLSEPSAGVYYLTLAIPDDQYQGYAKLEFDGLPNDPEWYGNVLQSLLFKQADYEDPEVAGAEEPKVALNLSLIHI